MHKARHLPAGTSPLRNDDYMCQSKLPLPVWLALDLVISVLIVGVCSSCRALLFEPLPSESVLAAQRTDNFSLSSSNTYTVTGENPTITEFFESPSAIKTLTLDLVPTEHMPKDKWNMLGFDVGNVLRVSISAKEVDTPNYREVFNGYIYTNSDATQTVCLNTGYTPIESIIITFPEATSGQHYTIDNISFNKKPLLNISPLFVAIVFFLLLVVEIARRKSFLSCAKIKNHAAWARGVVGVLIAFLCVLTVMMTYITRNTEEPSYFGAYNGIQNAHIYQYQTDAVLKGHAALDIPVPEWLAQAENPYDIEVRMSESAAHKQPYLFDYAFYNGRYYCYFGPLPVFLLFMPYRIITGTHLTNHQAMTILGILATLSVTTLGLMVLRRHRPSATVADAVLTALGSYLVSGIVFLVYLSVVYHLVIITSLICGTAGLTCWLIADGKGKSVRRVPLFIGSLLIGMTLLARPMTFLSVLLAFPIFGHRFWKQSKRERDFFSTTRQAITNTALVIVPIASMAVLALLWNYARFDNPLDFGYKYNLTGFDMTKTTWNGSRLAFGLSMYCFAPLNLIKSFPFMSNYITKSNLIIDALNAIPDIIIEPYYGSVLAFYPFLLSPLLIAGKRARAGLQNKHLSFAVLSLLAIGIAIAAFDSTVAVTQRYQSDFTWLIGLASLLIIVNAENSYRIGNKMKIVSLIRFLAAALVAISIVICAINLLAADRYDSLLYTNPQIWWTWRSWLSGVTALLGGTA